MASTGTADATGAETETAIEALADAYEAYEQQRDRVAEIGEADLKALANAYDRATTLLDRYERSASGTGDFEAFVTFGERFGDHVESLPEDLPERAAFERANERFEKRRLSTGDFDAAREILSGAGELVSRLDERREARERYRDARRTVRTRHERLSGRLGDLERIQEYNRVDLDAPTTDLREPIDAYNNAASETFATFYREASARAVLEFVRSARAFPLVSIPQPPADLLEYVERAEAGTEPIPDLLEYSEYSTSKLDHYVAEPQALQSNVAVHRTYLTGLDADTLTISWPPPPARELWWRTRELVSVLSRLDASEAIARLRRVRALVGNESRYGRLREAALASEALDERTRERLASGAIAEEIDRLETGCERLAEALSNYPSV